MPDLLSLSDPGMSILDRLDRMVYALDTDSWRLVWGNRATLDFWKMADREQLAARAFPISDAAKALVLGVRDRLAAGAETFVRLEQTLYPDGRAPERVALSVSRCLLADGRPGLFVEVTPVKVSDPETLRRMDAVRYAPLAISTHALDGMTLSANQCAQSVFGPGFDFLRMFKDGELARRLLARLARGEAVSEDAEVWTVRGARWFELDARSMSDPVTGLPAILLSAHDVTARRQAERAKDNLLGVVSHELRTPLTGIRGSLDLLAAGVYSADPAVHAELIDIARDNVVRLTRMVDDLLDVQRLAAGTVDLSLAAQDLSQLVTKAIDLHVPAAQVAGVSIQVVREEPVVCNIDSARILQVLSNLLSNAVKHSSAGQVIEVEVARSGPRARVLIADQGPGVPPSFRERLFGMFAQHDASDRRRVGGTGVGLYIARTLIKQHGGDLGYDPETSEGAQFYFELPLAEHVAAGTMHA